MSTSDSTTAGGSTDGLAAMMQQRQRASEKARGSARRVPAPRHPAKPAVAAQLLDHDVVVDPEPSRDPSAKAPSVATAGDGPVAEVSPSGPTTGTAASEVTPVDAAVVPLRRLTFYLDEPAHDWLEDIAFTGRRAKPRVDASRSAVVRLALERLTATMSAEQVVAELQGRAQRASGSPGRKRI